MKNILIVDSDLGFIFWLAKVLVEANHQPWPACSTFDAVQLLNRRRTPLDLLIINPSVQGATEFIDKLRHKYPDLKVLAVNPTSDRQVRGVHAWRARPSRADHSAGMKWMQEVDRLFGTQHRAA